MSFNRRKNIYTLGDFHQQHQVKVFSRGLNLDPFERDPFKIQSFNFRYADRPAFPSPTSASRPKPQATDKRFETFYYNYDFAPARRDKENSAANKFHEFRRRKFLYDHQQSAPTQQQQQPQVTHPQPNPESPRRTGLLRKETGAAWSSSFNYSGLNGPCGPSRASTPQPSLRSGSSRGHLPEFRSLPASHVSADFSTYSKPQQSSGSRVNAATSTDLFSHRSQTSLSGFGSADGLRRSANGLYGNGNGYSHSHSHSPSHSQSRSNNNTSRSQHITDAQISCTPISSPQSNRKLLQPLPVPAKDVVNGIAVSASNHNVECKRSGCSSGCQISINIKGLDDKPLGENFSIKINSDSSSNIKCQGSHRSHSSHRSQSSHRKDSASAVRQESCTTTTNDRQQHQTPSTHNLICQKTSSNTIAIDNLNGVIKIDKQSSKTSIRNFRSESPKRTVQRDEFLLPARKDAFRKISAPHFVVPHRSFSDRIPSVMPWNLEKNMRNCFNDDHLKANSAFGILSSGYGSSGLNDLKNLQQYEKLQQSHDQRRVAPTSPTAKTMPLKAEHNIFNLMTRRNLEDLRTNRHHFDDQPTRYKFEDPRTSRSTQELRVIRKSDPPVDLKKTAPPSGKRLESGASKHSICSVKDSRESRPRKSNNLNCFSETEFRSSRSADRKRQERRNLSPLNVNINVYTDRLKLLRV